MPGQDKAPRYPYSEQPAYNSDADSDSNSKRPVLPHMTGNRLINRRSRVPEYQRPALGRNDEAGYLVRRSQQNQRLGRADAYDQRPVTARDQYHKDNEHRQVERPMTGAYLRRPADVQQPRSGGRGGHTSASHQPGPFRIPAPQAHPTPLIRRKFPTAHRQPVVTRSDDNYGGERRIDVLLRKAQDQQRQITARYHKETDEDTDEVKSQKWLKLKPESEPTVPTVKSITDTDTVGELPHSWTYMNPEKEGFRLEEVRYDSPEYKQTEQAFLETTGSKFVIYKISRVQNPTQYKLFIQKKLGMEERRDGVTNMRHAWHGTDQGRILDICRGHFDRGFTTNHLYGKGVYLARDAKYSCSNQYSPPNRMGHKFVIYSQILTGHMATGKSNFVSPPQRTSQENYDSCVNDVEDPKIFVIFHDAAAYPKHVVEFSRAETWESRSDFRQFDGDTNW